MLCTGVDLAEIDRIDAALKRWGPRFLSRVYTPAEVRFCRGRVPELAARFAAKEAVMKALGTGARGIAWREIEILPARGGQPQVYLHGRAALRAEAIGLEVIAISLSHDKGMAIASVVGSGPGPDRRPERPTRWDEPVP
jgi:holo-[acyl-carrier protein] synthase